MEHPVPPVIITMMTKLSVCLSATLVAAGFLRAEPRIEIAESKFDFGTVVQNSTVVYKTWIRSVGDDSLQVFDIKSACGCSVVPSEKDRLAPGDSAQITFYWQTRQSIGEMFSSPYVFTSARQNPVGLVLMATAISPGDTTTAVACWPCRISFPNPVDRSRSAKHLSFTNYTDTDMTVELVSGHDDEYELDIPDTLRAGSTFTGTVKIKEAYFDGELERSFTLQFSQGSDVSHRATVPVAVGDFSYRPTFTTYK